MKALCLWGAFLWIVLPAAVFAGGKGASAKGSAPLSEGSVLRSHSLEQLDSAANLLMRAADGKSACAGVSSDEAKVLILPLRALLDQKTESYLSSHRKGRVSSPAWPKNCARDCHCGLYSSLLEKAGDVRLTADDRVVLKSVSSRAESVSAAELDACGSRAAKSFCSGKLLQYLRQEAPAFKAE